MDVQCSLNGHSIREFQPPRADRMPDCQSLHLALLPREYLQVSCGFPQCHPARRNALWCVSAGRAVSFLARQKGRLAACKQRRVAHVCAQAVDGTLSRLAAAGLDAAAMPCAPPSLLHPLSVFRANISQ